MLEITSWEFPSPDQFNIVFWGMRNPYKTRDRKDSYVERDRDEPEIFHLGRNDLKLARELIKSGPDHGKFLRQLPVILGIKAPLYWWKQMDKYQIGTVTNSESTMHTLTAKEFELSDFSLPEEKVGFEEVPVSGHESFDYWIVLSQPVEEALGFTIDNLNLYRDKYLETGEKKYWNAINALLPQSYNQERMWSGNYEVLRNIWFQRKGHRLKEWQSFREFIENNVPYFEDLVL